MTISLSVIMPVYSRSTTIEMMNRESQDRTVRMSDHLGIPTAVEV